MKSDVKVEGDRLPGAAGDGQAVPLMQGRGAGQQRHCVAARVVPHLGEAGGRGGVGGAAGGPRGGGAGRAAWPLTARSDTKLHCWVGRLKVGSLLRRRRENVRPGWSAEVTAELAREAGQGGDNRGWRLETARGGWGLAGAF